MDNNINLDPQQIQQMILMLQSMLPKQDLSESSEQQDTATKSKKKSPRTNNISIPKPSNNKFDSMPEMRMHKEDIAIDKKLIVQPPVPRARSFNFVKAICRVCGKKESVNPVLITDSIDRYKCNKCSGAAG
jgi:hypothetical protein